ncbi:MAG: glycoside hydrolase family 15 protein [Actinobacteria bacterium]|nr:glycoside hydrolase family 15 protein [Actinomycetota bacterium]
MKPIEDYALIGDTHSAALVALNGSIDWLCLPRFDSPSCFGALLDEAKGGHWRICSADPAVSIDRAYRDDSMVLETAFSTRTGTVTVIDCLPFETGSQIDDPRAIHTQDVVVRIVRGEAGVVEMAMTYEPRFDYGYVMPWFRQAEGRVEAIGGPDALDLCSDLVVELSDGGVHSRFDVEAGEVVCFIAAYHKSHDRGRTFNPREALGLVERTDRIWRTWAGRCTYQGRWRPELIRSLLTLKALIYSPTGGIVAAPTTSLPEAIGGVRNWDYRFCWLRDATFTLEVLLDHGFTSEAREWRNWLQTAVAGDPEDLQIMYGVGGERRLPEAELAWLNGYDGSSPVRTGNGAVEQFQLDVYGEVMDSFHSARRAGIETSSDAWDLEKDIIEFVCSNWGEPDEGIWEVRSGRKNFVHSKVMAWVAVDRAVQAVDTYGRSGPVERWRRTRADIVADVMTKGIAGGRFRRAYEDDGLDASLLMLPLVGFIPASHEVMEATVDAIDAELSMDALVHRYKEEEADDGLPPGEGSFFLCAFWLVNCLVLLGRTEDAAHRFERLLELRNDVGLLSEQFDRRLDRLLGNFPQAFSHTALVTSAMALDRAGGRRPLARGQ